MDSILELDAVEIKHIKETIAANKDLFQQNAHLLFEDAFHVLLSSQAKVEGFYLLKQISSGDGSEQLNDLFNVVLMVCTQIFKQNLKGTEEFNHVIDDLGLRSKAQDLGKAFTNAYLKRTEQLQNVYDDE